MAYISLVADLIGIAFGIYLIYLGIKRLDKFWDPGDEKSQKSRENESEEPAE